MVRKELNLSGTIEQYVVLCTTLVLPESFFINGKEMSLQLIQCGSNRSNISSHWTQRFRSFGDLRTPYLLQ